MLLNYLAELIAVNLILGYIYLRSIFTIINNHYVYASDTVDESSAADLLLKKDEDNFGEDSDPETEVSTPKPKGKEKATAPEAAEGEDESAQKCSFPNENDDSGPGTEVPTPKPKDKGKAIETDQKENEPLSVESLYQKIKELFSDSEMADEDSVPLKEEEDNALDEEEDNAIDEEEDDEEEFILELLTEDDYEELKKLVSKKDLESLKLAALDAKQRRDEAEAQHLPTPPVTKFNLIKEKPQSQSTQSDRTGTGINNDTNTGINNDNNGESSSQSTQSDQEDSSTES